MLASIEPLLKHQWPDIGSMFELHWRDTAVFVSLSSRTNTRWGVLVTLDSRSQGRAVRRAKLLVHSKTNARVV